MKNDFAMLQKQLGYKFKNVRLLEQALCHKSYINETADNDNSYERLEFLGDSVLGVVVSRYIYDNYASFPEGELTKLRASVVCEDSLSKLARKLNLGEYIYLSNGERHSGGADKDAILCDVFESVIAAIYLDSNMEKAQEFILNNLEDVIKDHAKHRNSTTDYKTTLQEFVQQTGGKVEYKIVSESGPDHDKQYDVVVYVNGKKTATGRGHSKKKAQQDAAKNAITEIIKK